MMNLGLSVKRVGLAGGFALALSGLAAPASAAVVSVSIDLIGFSTLNLSGVAGNPGTNTFVTSAGGSINNASYSFPSAGNGTGSGIYAGTVSIAKSPYGTTRQDILSQRVGVVRSLLRLRVGRVSRGWICCGEPSILKTAAISFTPRKAMSLAQW